MAYQARKNPDDTITVSHETQTFNQEKGAMDIEIHGEITMPADEWARAARAVLSIADGGTVAAAQG